MSFRYFVLLLAAITITVVLGQEGDDLSDTLDYFRIKRKTKYCGQNLSNVLSLACANRGGFNGYANTMRKKSTTFSWYPLPMDVDGQTLEEHLGLADELEETMNPQMNPKYPFTNPMVAKQVLNRSFRRRRRGVSDECCKKSCSWSELTSYCRFPSPKDNNN